MQIKDANIGFIGGGNMARAILTGLTQSFSKQQLFVSDRNLDKREYFREELGIQATESYHDFIDRLDVVILAIKPQGFPELLKELKASLRSDQLVISIAAGITTKAISKGLGERGFPIVRTMPNTPATIGLGATALFANNTVSKTQKKLADTIFKSCGVTAWLEEETQLSAAVAVSGSSPAYFFYLMECMVNMGEKLGLSRENSDILTKQAMLGAARFSQTSKDSLSQLKKNVMSPEGTTERAIFALEDAKLETIIEDAMRAAFDRDRELSEIISAKIED